MKNKFPNKKQKTVVVLGPPRSGTSTMGGLLSILGVDMGRVREPKLKNPKGFYEDRDFLNLIDGIYEQADPESSGWSPPPLEKILNQKDKFDGRIKDLIKNRSQSTQSSAWGWKVVGTNLTIELFLPYLTSPHFIVTFRNILDTAKSTVEYTRDRERLTLTEAIELSIFYYQNIFAFLRKYPALPKIFVSYDDVLNNPQTETKRLAEFLDLRLTTEQLHKVRKFVIPREKIRKEREKFRIMNFFTSKIPRYIKKTIENPLKPFEYIYKSIRTRKK
jgi:hypothetical protein